MRKVLGIGRTAKVIEWENHQVLKLFYPRIPFEEVLMEYQKQLPLSQRLPCCAKVYGLIEVEDRYGILYEKAEGLPLTELLFGHFIDAAEAGEIFGKNHRLIHEVVLEELPSVKEELRNTITSSEHIEKSWKEPLLRILFSLPEGNSLCHLDYHPDNFYLHDDGIKVLDWMTAVKGHPYADVARTEMILKYAVLPQVDRTTVDQVNFTREVFLRSYHKTYFGKPLTFEEEALLRKWETVLLAARLSENLSEEEYILLKKELDGRLAGLT